ncbi:hydrolase [Streptococcus criceti]|uniref:Metallo-beta-lactamase family protein n=1 Tax=Streptococcus criceti HS-6 TaxID=873449 RepID=G5JRI1_STRCG|nr:MBL fold metallo-hydrolase [Streptococcus criceti]EHI74503.1 metallo-beta-lactamase family protein [Streptococcus criceti HS-6]SUN42926.1 hydrolase [Streptococcus criceti]
MKIYTIKNQVALENTYILENEQALLVIDPGSNGQDILAKLNDLVKPVAAVLLTHAHYDHIMSLDAVRDKFGQAPAYISEKEAGWLTNPVDNLSGLPCHDDMVNVRARPADHFYRYRQNYELAGFNFTVVPTPGHSWGSVSLIFKTEEAVFSGDALFCETIGRTDLPTGNRQQLLDAIRKELFILPNHYHVYPGHGFDTTIGHEKTFNPFFRN